MFTPATSSALEPRARVESQRADDTPSLTCRRLFERDLDKVVALEEESFEFPWRREDFLYCLTTGRCDGLVVEYRGELVAYIIYETRRRAISTLTCAVAPEFRRKGVGAFMMQRLVEKLDARRPEIVCVVREGNLVAQHFLKALGFKAWWVAQGFYCDTNEDAYRLTFRPDPDALVANRIRKVA